MNKLESELTFTRKIPAEQRIIYLDHHITENGEGEPALPEEIIVEHHSSNLKY